MSAPALLDPAFVRELEALRRRLVVRAASGSSGERTSRRRGGHAEFQDHRPYAPGDDLRRVDWLAFARSGEPVVKQFRAEEDVVLRLVIDASASLEGEKFDALLRIAAALGYLGLASGERVQVLPFADGALPPARAIRGRAGLASLLRALGGITPRGGTRLGAALDAALARGRPGLLVVLSDFLDSHGVERPLSLARAAGHDVLLVQVLSREEVAPSLSGDLLLEDAETGETVALTADADAVEAYLARLAGLFEQLRRWARAHGAAYVRAISDEGIEPAVRRVVDRRVDA